MARRHRPSRVLSDSRTSHSNNGVLMAIIGFGVLQIPAGRHERVRGEWRPERLMLEEGSFKYGAERDLDGTRPGRPTKRSSRSVRFGASVATLVPGDIPSAATLLAILGARVCIEA